MKFKSDKDVTMTPVNFEDIVNELDNVLNMELEQAVEHLDDLEILHANIEKYGITEPVMHLVGGTLESMSISIADKESCLEGLKEGLKEAGKKVWEVILAIFGKILEFLAGSTSKKYIDKCDELLEKGSIELRRDRLLAHAFGAKNTGILSHQLVVDVTRTIDGYTDFTNIEQYLSSKGAVVVKTDKGIIDFSDNIKESFESDGSEMVDTLIHYGDTRKVLIDASALIKRFDRIKDYSKKCIKAAELFAKGDNGGVHKQKELELRMSAQACNKLLHIIITDVSRKIKAVSPLY